MINDNIENDFFIIEPEAVIDTGIISVRSENIALKKRIELLKESEKIYKENENNLLQSYNRKLEFLKDKCKNKESCFQNEITNLENINSTLE